MSLNMPLVRKSLASLILAGGLLAAVSAHAHTSETVDMVCPYDGVKFKFEAQTSGTAFFQMLDGMLVGPIESPSPLAVCPTNGFVFFKEEYSTDELERLRPLIMSAEYQALKGETPYYRAAWIMQRTGSPHPQVSLALLQATWEAGWAEVLERAAKAEQEDQKDAQLGERLVAQGTTSERYRRYATELLARLSVDVADKTRSAEEHIADRMLTGEILRRLGRFEEADGQFVALAGDLTPAGNEAKIVALQRRLIAAKDLGLHDVSEALGKEH
ncbi:MAG: hypothetical protein FWD68_01370 [Alphaproteobacteria bacterium]|nr:hypothetical protein [Alphaproteobacteria bacterium]